MDEEKGGEIWPVAAVILYLSQPVLRTVEDRSVSFKPARYEAAAEFWSSGSHGGILEVLELANFSDKS